MELAMILWAAYTSTTLPVFLSVLCDNLLLTVVVPILPELLRDKDFSSSQDSFNSSSSKGLGQNQSDSATSGGVPDVAKSSSCLKEIFHLRLLEENSQLGILYSTKAFVQLITNPFVGKLTLKIGYKIPLCLGNFILLLCSLVFGFADSYALYTIGRSCHGLASSLISISGMALVAESFQDDEQNRTKFLGRVMGAAALGVLIGYPFGGISYALFGKTTPFLCIATLAAFNVVIQFARLGMDHRKSHKAKVSLEEATELTELVPHKETLIVPTIVSTSILTLLKDQSILVIVVSIWLTTSAMSVLEPTLPIWLIDTIDPSKWQLGLVFVPDSLGYFIGTNYFGEVALRVGRWKMSMGSMAAVGISCFMLPLARRIWQLALPHFILGLGLGIVDASLMPLLASLADENHHSTGYGIVYSLAQTAVALAYSFGPLIGGELVPLIGFPDLMRTLGFINLLFCPLLSLLAPAESTASRRISERQSLPVTSPSSVHPHHQLSISKQLKISSLPSFIQPAADNPYQRFHDELDSD